MHVCHTCMCAVAFIWRSEDNWWEPVLSFHHAGPKVRTAVVGLAAGAFTPELLSHWLACVPLSSGLTLMFPTTVASKPFSKEPGFCFFHLIRIYSVLYSNSVIF